MTAAVQEAAALEISRIDRAINIALCSYACVNSRSSTAEKIIHATACSYTLESRECNESI